MGKGIWLRFQRAAMGELRIHGRADPPPGKPRRNRAPTAWQQFYRGRRHQRKLIRMALCPRPFQARPDAHCYTDVIAIARLRGRYDYHLTPRRTNADAKV